ncbi:MAG: hypothetical protein FWD95_04105 [Nocardioidaceae bacterium]|nr:hypothetical protein [Nocardioidaceae bacterium]
MVLKHHHAARLHAEAGLTGTEFPAHESNWHQTVGQLVHHCCADHANLRHLPAHELAQRVIDWASVNVKATRTLGNLAKARAAIASNANVYLTRYAPGPDAQFLGAEIPVGDGRIDLAWFIPDFGVLVDELKTVRQVHMHADNPGITQCHGYVDAGLAEWGDLFAGVRYLPLSIPSQALFFAPDHGTHTLSRYTPADVIRQVA